MTVSDNCLNRDRCPSQNDEPHLNTAAADSHSSSAAGDDGANSPSLEYPC